MKLEKTIGNLMQYIYALEQGNHTIFNIDSYMQKARLGFMQHHNIKYPGL